MNLPDLTLRYTRAIDRMETAWALLRGARLCRHMQDDTERRLLHRYIRSLRASHRLRLLLETHMKQGTL